MLAARVQRRPMQQSDSHPLASGVLVLHPEQDGPAREVVALDPQVAIQLGVLTASDYLDAPRRVVTVLDQRFVYPHHQRA
jgi:hypothetical protein